MASRIVPLAVGVGQVDADVVLFGSRVVAQGAPERLGQRGPQVSDQVVGHSLPGAELPLAVGAAVADSRVDRGHVGGVIRLGLEPDPAVRAQPVHLALVHPVDVGGQVLVVVRLVAAVVALPGPEGGAVGVQHVLPQLGRLGQQSALAATRLARVGVLSLEVVSQIDLLGGPAAQGAVEGLLQVPGALVLPENVGKKFNSSLPQIKNGKL